MLLQSRGAEGVSAGLDLQACMFLRQHVWLGPDISQETTHASSKVGRLWPLYEFLAKFILAVCQSRA